MIILYNLWMQKYDTDTNKDIAKCLAASIRSFLLLVSQSSLCCYTSLIIALTHITFFHVFWFIYLLVHLHYKEVIYKIWLIKLMYMNFKIYRMVVKETYAVVKQT